MNAATLFQIEEIKIQFTVLAAYDTNGLTTEHKAAIKDLKQLNEIILGFLPKYAPKANPMERHW